MAAKKFQEAVKAFKRCVNIDTDVSHYSNLCIVVQYSSYKVKDNERLSTFLQNFEAWNNMASAYIQLKDK